MGRFDYIEEIQKTRFDRIQEIEKFNPYHDAKGRFSTANGAVSFTYKPGQGKIYDNAIAREKARYAAMGPTPKAGLAAGLGEEHAKAIEKAVQNSAEELKALWDKYADQITVADTNARVGACDYTGRIKVNLASDARGDKGGPPYETTLHESGHSIDRAISRKVGYRFSESYNDGEFEKFLVKEANQYIKNHQKKMSEEQGRKVPIAEARSNLGSLTRKAGYEVAGDVSDMLEGATKGKFTGVAGHGKAYWTGGTVYGHKTKGHSVATEAFAEMFSASTVNPKSLAKIKEVFPGSYHVFQKMIKEAATFE